MSLSTFIARDPQDLDLEARVANFLANRPFQGSQRLSVHAEDGVVTVQGRVKSYYEKQLAPQLLRRVAGVVRLVDEVEVAPAAKQEAGDVRPAAEFSQGTWVWPVVIGALLVVSAIGCGRSEYPQLERLPTQPVTGQITFAGKPIPGAFVVLHPRKVTAEKVPAGRAQVASDGTFIASTYLAGDGVVPGEYAVTVQWHKLVSGAQGTHAGPNVLPAKYAKLETTDIFVTVAPGSNQIPPIAIK